MLEPREHASLDQKPLDRRAMAQFRAQDLDGGFLTRTCAHAHTSKDAAHAATPEFFVQDEASRRGMNRGLLHFRQGRREQADRHAIGNRRRLFFAREQSAQLAHRPGFRRIKRIKPFHALFRRQFERLGK
ncbi:hypothetical protein [Dokdonella immobilis]|uniref:hypothetical protein n=1 Tax=Dokdonella immobilis TaxID=578942 RepID=UPI001FE7D44F|nr:hypothetical protein [Dokdonella immobilis]